ncbi:hypothetical protein CPAR01_03571 [Colletotrichum paranaense]|uniref:Uncharacterized protein n=4 Tax=Colletotrichum acutatum species complex TaxID=2707335 RepID=A0AAI9YWD8_9PEZI|nr:uncharacterized protein CCOS01_08706 [Colletotrichum costaricense]XP_060352064.1 uncharacterized protein CPAR01_03571 [Colletotrichum paranaense]XP_060385412.1 uncharacterized protein CTAM01_03961 [Colletotrichum tamarilloi]KAI3529913.1 hypothetical protein CSPX01_15210 [Colletotrichum filicis]KAK1469435.1 hypothetical protein CMEL01_01202 [Colletotrichum melonis]KAK1504654.1 hypothetical protein CTAM01_03961 [Colletotrichum tamarilloi]KAK1526288.1 hypothetical protein CCOS01_08706 [Collet
MTRPVGAAREDKKTSFRHCIANPPVIGGWPKVSMGCWACVSKCSGAAVLSLEQN